MYLRWRRLFLHGKVKTETAKLCLGSFILCSEGRAATVWQGCGWRAALLRSLIRKKKEKKKGGGLK